MTESVDCPPINTEPFQAPANGRGLLTVKGPSSKILDRLSVTREISARASGVIRVALAGVKGGKGETIDLSPSQARDLAVQILRAAGENDIAKLIPRNVSQDMRDQSDLAIIRLGDALRLYHGEQLDGVIPQSSRRPSALPRIQSIVSRLWRR